MTVKKKEDEQQNSGATPDTAGQPPAQEGDAAAATGLFPPIGGVRTTFICVDVAHATYKPGSGYSTRRVTFEPVQDDDDNVALLGRSPKASIVLEVESTAAEQFEPGVTYTVDLVPIDFED